MTREEYVAALAWRLVDPAPMAAAEFVIRLLEKMREECADASREFTGRHCYCVPGVLGKCAACTEASESHDMIRALPLPLLED